MTDLSEFTTRRKRTCIVAKMVEKLSETDREKFNAACEEKTIQTSVIVRWLAERTKTVSKYDSVRLHRVQECCCYA